MGKEWEWEDGCEGVQGAADIDQFPAPRPEYRSRHPFAFLDHGALSCNLTISSPSPSLHISPAISHHLPSCRVPLAFTRRRVLVALLMMRIFSPSTPPSSASSQQATFLGSLCQPLYHYHLTINTIKSTFASLFANFSFTLLIVQLLSNILLAMFSVVYPALIHVDPPYLSSARRRAVIQPLRTNHIPLYRLLSVLFLI